MTEQATFKLREVEGIPVVDVHGEIDISNIEQFKESLRTASSGEAPALIVKLEHVTYLDSHAIAALVVHGKRLHTIRRRPYVVAGPKSAAGKILGISNVNLAIPLCESIEDAVSRERGATGGAR
ncbi:MAG: STAS domain-containing protein [Candidatus Eremiobacteraeota bacterium]|nr:STAS domain-containing protein [Candidatus Eremiobacteraeota bacterium]